MSKNEYIFCAELYLMHRRSNSLQHQHSCVFHICIYTSIFDGCMVVCVYALSSARRRPRTLKSYFATLNTRTMQKIAILSRPSKSSDALQYSTYTIQYRVYIQYSRDRGLWGTGAFGEGEGFGGACFCRL